MTAESTLQRVLAAEFDDYTVHGPVRVGNRNTVYEVTVDGRRAACKMTERQPGVLAREGTLLLTLQARTAVQVPTVLGMGDGYLLLEWVEGDTYAVDAPPEERLALLAAVGRTLARLHNATQEWFQGHGTLELGDGPLTVDEPSDWPDRLRTFVAEWAATVATTRFAAVGNAVVETVRTNRELFADCPPVLVHGEVSPDHVVADRGGTVTLIDWELAQAAPGAFDLVWAERDLLGRPVTAEDSGVFSAALLDGYRAERALCPAFRFHRDVYRAAFALRELSVMVRSGTPAQRESDGRGGLLRDYIADRVAAAESIARRLDR